MVFDLRAASPVAPPDGSVGVIRCCVEDGGVVVDGVVVSFRPATPLGTELADEAAVGVSVDDSPVPGG